MSRPTIFTDELADSICERVAYGESMRSICRDDAMPSMSSIFKWLRENEKFSQQYAKACEERSEAMIEEMLEIADDGSEDVQRSRLRVDTRKWYASKLKPKKYGDRLGLDHDGQIDVRLVD